MAKKRERERERQTSKGRYPRSLRLWGKNPPGISLGTAKGRPANADQGTMGSKKPLELII